MRHPMEMPDVFYVGEIEVSRKVVKNLTVTSSYEPSGKYFIQGELVEYSHSCKRTCQVGLIDGTTLSGTYRD